MKFHNISQLLLNNKSTANMHIHELNPAESDENPVLCEAFEWNLKADHKHWQRLRLALPSLKDIGIDYLWLPPGSKARDLESNGYDIYDPYDLGEFDQKGGIPTKFGTKEDLLELAEEAKRMQMGLIWDAIFNHRGFADGTEMVKVVEVDQNGM
jgi:alpha-amylase